MRSNPSLCICDNATFLPWRSWSEIAALPEPDAVVIVVPIAGMAEHGEGLPLDVEERVLMRVVKEASLEISGRLGEAMNAKSVRILVVPPLRFVAGPAGGAAFTVEVPVAHAFIDEVCASLAAAGFRKVVLCNASSWNEELCDAAARDIRIARGLQMFCVNLSALEIGFTATEDGEFAKAGKRLAALFAEIAGRPALANGGKILTMKAVVK